MSETLLDTPAFAFGRFTGPAGAQRWRMTVKTPDRIAVLTPEGLRRLKQTIDAEVLRVDSLERPSRAGAVG